MESIFFGSFTPIHVLRVLFFVKIANCTVIEISLGWRYDLIKNGLE